MLQLESQLLNLLSLALQQLVQLGRQDEFCVDGALGSCMFLEHREQVGFHYFGRYFWLNVSTRLCSLASLVFWSCFH